MSTSHAMASLMFHKDRSIVKDLFFHSTSSQPVTFGPTLHPAMALVLNLESLGYCVDSSFFLHLTHASLSEMQHFWQFIQREHRQLYPGESYRIVFPCFPDQSLSLSQLNDLWPEPVDPQFLKGFRPLTVQNPVDPSQAKTLTPLILRDASFLKTSFCQLLEARTSWSPAQHEMARALFLYWATTDAQTLIQCMTSTTVSHREILASLGSWVIQQGFSFEKLIQPSLSSPTDLLRLSAALNDGDTSLSMHTRIKTFPRALRRLFLSSLNQLLLTRGHPEDHLQALFLHRQPWLHLAYALHSGSYARSYPEAFQALQRLRQGAKPLSFLHRVHQALQSPASGPSLVTSLLMQRPGVFARSLAWILRSFTSQDDRRIVLAAFSQVARSVSTPVLIQMHAQFKYNSSSSTSVIFPKKAHGILYLKTHAAPLNVLSPEELDTIIDLLEGTLISRFSQAPSLGTVYVDPALSRMMVPFSQKTASKTVKTWSKGSRFPKTNNLPVIRFFTWWNESGFDASGRFYSTPDSVDIDLSLAVLSSDYSLISYCSFYSLHEQDVLVHSGDCLSAPQGAAEYVDVHLERLQALYPHARYVVALVSSYTHQQYADIPECYSGWMERSDSESGAVFDPSTVQVKLDLTSPNTQLLTCLYDIQHQEYIWADTPLKGYSLNTLSTALPSLQATVQGLVEMQKPRLYDLVMLHVRARGVLIDDVSLAQTVFSLNQGITPFDTDYIVSELLKDSYS